MRYDIVRMPKTDEAIRKALEPLEPYIAAMYSEQEEEVHGPFQFMMDQFLLLWSIGGAFIIVKRDDEGNPMLVALCNHYTDMWCSRSRVEIQRLAMGNLLDEKTERDALINYLKGVSSLLKFDQLYYNTHYVDGSIYKELVWNDKV